jgi:predicted DNA-binding transcriptional regulator AlpA
MTSGARKKVRAAQAAGYIGVGRSTLAKWRMNGKGPPYHRCGPRIVYYYINEIEAWQDECDRRESEESQQRQRRPRGQK